MLWNQESCFSSVEHIRIQKRTSHIASNFAGLSTTTMAKGKAVRQREKRIHSTISRQSNKEVINDKTTFTNHENFPSHSFWKYSSFTILALLGSMALFCSKDSLLSCQTLSSKNAFHDSEENVKLQFPCHVGDEWSIDRRSNLSLEEFVQCYDAKRYFLLIQAFTRGLLYLRGGRFLSVREEWGAKRCWRSGRWYALGYCI